MASSNLEEKKPTNYYPKRNLPYLELTGLPNQNGYKIGLQHKTLIQKEFKYLLKTIMKLSPRLSSKEQLLNLTSKYFPYAKFYSPELIEEIEGISEGSGLTIEEIFFLNCFSDIISDVTNPILAMKLVACTSYGVSKEATVEGQTFVGQNFDLNILYESFPIILKIKPKSGPTSLIYTIAGTVGCIGQNSFGISVANNKLFASDSRPGVPFTFIVRKVLQQKTMGDAIEAVTTAHRTTGLNYIIGNSKDEIFDLETTATDLEVIYSHSGFVAHANHYLADRLKHYQLMLLGDSLVRYDRAAKFLKAKFGELNIEHLKMILRDHSNYPKSICNHPDTQLPKYQRMRTISALIMKTSKREMLVTNGNPCNNEFYEYKL